MLKRTTLKIRNKKMETVTQIKEKHIIYHTEERKKKHSSFNGRRSRLCQRTEDVEDSDLVMIVAGL